MNKKQHFRDDDQWEKMGDHVPDEIKNWVAAKQVDDRHPIEKMVDRQHAKGAEVAHMASGGMVPDDIRSWMEPQGAGMMAPSLYGGSDPAPQPPVAAPVAPVQPPAPPPGPPPVAAPAIPAAPGPDFNAQADKIMGSSPESRQADFQRTQAPNLVNALSTLGAGAGDAIARGYGHDAGAHHLEDVQGIIQGKNKALLENADKQAAMGKERFGIEQTLEAKNPTSPLSQALQKSYGPLLLKIGFKPQDVAGMSASNISDLTGKSVDVLKAEAESAMAGATLGLKKVEGESNIIHQRATEHESETARQQEAAKALAGRGFWATAGSMIPFSANRSATKVLQEQAAGTPAHSFGSEQEAEAAKLPPGTVIMINGRKARVK